MRMSHLAATVARMENFDLLGIILAAIAGVPGQLIAAYQENPGPWNMIGLMMLGALALTLVGNWISARLR